MSKILLFYNYNYDTISKLLQFINMTQPTILQHTKIWFDSWSIHFIEVLSKHILFYIYYVLELTKYKTLFSPIMILLLYLEKQLK
jgi:hypothetical protein